MLEKKRIRWVDDTISKTVTTDCMECGKEVILDLDALEDKGCCSFVYSLEPVIDLVVYEKEKE